MDFGKCNCAYPSVIVAILAGVALSVLYALGRFVIKITGACKNEIFTTCNLQKNFV